MGQLVFQANSGGQTNLVGQNTASTFNLNIPLANGTLVSTGDTGTVTNTMLAGSITNAKLVNSSVTIGSTSVALGATSTTLDGVNIGATTPGTGAFTTFSASSTTTLSGGTANGVAYLNGSKVLTTGSALTFDGTTLLLGSNGSFTSGYSGNGLVLSKTNVGSKNAIVSIADTSSVLLINNSSAGWDSVATYAAGSEGMRLTSTGLGIGTSSITSGSKLTIAGGNLNLTQSDSRFIGGDTVGRSIFTNSSVTTYIAMYGSSHATLPNVMSFVANGNAMTFDASGNLGLGVTPSAWQWTAFQTQKAALSGGSSGDRMDLSQNYFRNGGAGQDQYIGSGFATNYRQITGTHSWYVAPSGTAGNAISFTQAMTLDNSGNLLVGTTSNSFKLTVTGTDSSTGGINVTGTGSNGLRLFQDGSNGNSYIQNYQNGFMAFSTNNTERARIDSSGNLLVNMTSASAPNPGFGVFKYAGGNYTVIGHTTSASSGDAYSTFYYNGTSIGSITQAGTTGVLYNITSDYRLKNVIGAVSGSGERIDALQPIDYTMKADGSQHRGFLAHQFQEVYANSVSGVKDAVDAEGKPVYQTMQASTSEVIADLVAEIQSLRARLKAANIA